MYHERRKQLLTLPNSRAETHDRIDQHQVTSCRGEPMIHVNDAAKGIIILTTRTNMQLLCDRNAQIFGDGTFKTCQRFFYQLYNLHAYKNRHYVLCVFALLPSKAQDACVSTARCHSGFRESYSRSSKIHLASDSNQRLPFSLEPSLVPEDCIPWSF